MIRFLFKWSLQITGVGIVTYNQLLNRQQQANAKGAFYSVVNSAKASVVLGQSVYDYYNGLTGIQYNTQQYHKKRSQIHTRTANRILQLSKSNKGIYMKLGQYLGNLDRVMPWEYTKVLSVLQDSGPSIPYQQVKVVLQDDLQIEPKYVFSKFNKKAVAAASLAQVHYAKLQQTGQQVAVKIQFPFLKFQSKLDLFFLQKITQFCDYLMRKNNFKQVDLVSLYKTWTNTLVQQLDFLRQVANAQHTRNLFKKNRTLHIPKIHQNLCSQRLIVMQYIHGVKINQPQKIKQLGFDTKKVGSSLVKIFSDMIFKHGFVHCDAHPGNILVRPNPKRPQNYQIVLLDHGLYRNLQPQFINNFSKFWLSLVKFDKKGIKQNAKLLNIDTHYQYLPIIFLGRTVQSKKKLGQNYTQQQKKYFRQKDIANFEAIHKLIQDLPKDLMFVIRATNLISSHNVNLGGTQRQRYQEFTQHALRTLYSGWGYTFGATNIALRLWLFQNINWLHRILFGTLVK